MDDRERKEYLALAEKKSKHLRDIVDRSHAAEADLLILEKYEDAEAQRRSTLEAMVALEKVELEIEQLCRIAPA